MIYLCQKEIYFWVLGIVWNEFPIFHWHIFDDIDTMIKVVYSMIKMILFFPNFFDVGGMEKICNTVDDSRDCGSKIEIKVNWPLGSFRV